MDFDKDFYMKMLHTSEQTGFLDQWKPWKAARLMAIVQVWGNNEGFTLSGKFNCDREYIQERYHIEGGEVADAEFANWLKNWLKSYESVKSNRDPLFQEAASWISGMYGFKLYC